MNKNLSYTRVPSPCADRESTHFANQLQVLWHTLTLLMLSLLAQPAWAASDNDETVIIDGKTYHVLQNNDDWMYFRSLVEEAEGLKEVNAIMAEDFGVTSSVGSTDVPFKGTFDGNGHTLNVNISNSNVDTRTAPFAWAGGSAVIKNLHENRGDGSDDPLS